MTDGIVVVGASLAGLRAAETVRSAGYEGGLTLVGAEVHLPYDRPPLSKKLLAGEWEPDRIALRKADELDGLGADVRLGVAAVALDCAARTVTLGDGSSLGYEGLVIATGAAPRRLPDQPSLAGVHELRTLDDSLALRAELAGEPKDVVVIGAGFIGAEVAATARQRGHHVTIVEALPVPLARALGPEMGQACAELHRDHGVEVLLGVGVASLEGGERVQAVLLVDGRRLPADVVVVGIGVVPTTGWLAGSGLQLRDGVVCDATLAAGPRGVYAAGDLARWPNALFDDEEMRVEHWTNAAEQGAAAAQNLVLSLAGQPGEPYAPVPFFWSDQYDSRIQFLGRAGPDDEVRLVFGSVADRSFLALYRHGDRLHGVLGLNQTKRLMGYRRLLMNRTTWDEAVAHATS